METSQLLQELSNKDKHEIQAVLVALMLKEKISFIEVNSSYIESLKVINNFNKDVLLEAGTCLIQGLTFKCKDYSDRTIYVLENYIKNYDVKNIKKDFYYDENNGKKLCQITNKL